MSLIWADGFDAYGTDSALFRAAGYSGVGNPIASDATVARTGAGYVHIGASQCEFIRSLTTPLDIVGVGIAVQTLQAGVAADNRTRCIGFVCNGVNGYVAIAINNNLGLTVYLNGSGTVLGRSANNLFRVGGPYRWIEARIRNNAANGGLANSASLEIQTSGPYGNVPLLTINGFNLPYQIQGVDCGAFGIGGLQYQFNADDFVIWDSTGTTNNDFLGDRRLATDFLSANTVEADWTATGGAAYSVLSNVPPNDAQFVTGVNAGDVSEYQKRATALQTHNIAGVGLFCRAKATDIGPATFRFGVNSGGSVQETADLAAATTFAYMDPLILPSDPNGNVAWTRAAYNALKLRLNRTA